MINYSNVICSEIFELSQRNTIIIEIISVLFKSLMILTLLIFKCLFVVEHLEEQKMESILRTRLTQITKNKLHLYNKTWSVLFLLYAKINFIKMLLNINLIQVWNLNNSINKKISIIILIQFPF